MTTDNFNQLHKHLGHKTEVEQETNWNGYITRVYVKCNTCNEKLFYFDNLEEQEKLYPLWTKGVFGMGYYQNWVKGYHITSSRFPGEEKPGIEVENLLTWLQREWPGREIIYVPDTDTFRVPLMKSDMPYEDQDDKTVVSFEEIIGEVELTEDGFKRLYKPSSWEFAWLDDPNEPCQSCLHPRSDHPYGKDGGCSWCNCSKFFGMYE